MRILLSLMFILCSFAPLPALAQGANAQAPQKTRNFAEAHMLELAIAHSWEHGRAWRRIQGQAGYNATALRELDELVAALNDGPLPAYTAHRSMQWSAEHNHDIDDAISWCWWQYELSMNWSQADTWYNRAQDLDAGMITFTGRTVGVPIDDILRWAYLYRFYQPFDIGTTVPVDGNGKPHLFFPE